MKVELQIPLVKKTTQELSSLKLSKNNSLSSQHVLNKLSQQSINMNSDDLGNKITNTLINFNFRIRWR